MFIAIVIGLVRGLWLLLYPGYWAFTGAALGDPIVALCPRDPAALNLQVGPLHTPQQFINEMDVVYLTVLVLSLGGPWVGQPASFPSSLLPGQALQCWLARPM